MINIQFYTIKGGSRRAEKSRNMLRMMMKAVKLGLAGPGVGREQIKSKSNQIKFICPKKNNNVSLLVGFTLISL